MEKGVFISIGSNLGDRVSNCLRAMELLTRDKEKVAVTNRSSFYETEPWGRLDQPRFINCVVEVSTSLSPRELLDHLKDIEAGMGRRPGQRWGPRLIDLDLIFYGSSAVAEEGLTVPHPLAHMRAFVMAPLSEIAPDLVHPLLKKKVSEILDGLGSSSVRKLRKEEL